MKLLFWIFIKKIRKKFEIFERVSGNLLFVLEKEKNIYNRYIVSSKYELLTFSLKNITKPTLFEISLQCVIDQF